MLSARYLLRWLAISVMAGVLAGVASATLLFLLEWATAVRESHIWLITLLPLAGFAVGLVYKHYGKSVEAGNNLLLEEIHDPKAVIPLRMTPLVLLGTAMSHLFGGSAGREGTALQTGASLADQLTRPLRLDHHDRRILLMAGISAGFGSVFGTPLAGAVFGLEVLAIGRMRYDALIPCFLSAMIADRMTIFLGIHHTAYHVPPVPPSLAGIAWAVVAGIGFGSVAMLFARATHAISALGKRWISSAPLRPVVGGAMVASAVFLLGTTRYIGLGVPTIVEAFSHPLQPWDFAAKFVFTAITLGSGFKGGEVTPLFFIGATFGNALSRLIPLPFPLLAGMGFCAVFAGAANTPIASTLMAMEIFGAETGVYVGIASVVSYLFSGHAGIYGSQRVGLSKYSRPSPEEGLPLSMLPVVDQHEEVYSRSDLPPAMNSITILRLYFASSATVAGKQWWRKMMSRNLGHYLLQQAKEAGFHQAILHPVSAGFLNGDPVSWNLSDIPPAKLPQCLEIIGDEELLNAFLAVERPHLTNVRAVLLRSGEVFRDSDAISDLAE